MPTIEQPDRLARPATDRPAVGGNLALIQAFRGIAALSVALHHSAHRIVGLPGVVAGTQTFWLGRLVNPEVGAVGVDLFFIISGFIMTYTTPRESHPTARAFLWRRFLRIYPLYWLLSFVALAMLASRWVQGLKYSALAIAKSLVLYPTLYQTSVRPVLLSQGWTLIYEMLFYVLFALTIGLSRPRQVVAVFALLTGLFVGANFLPAGHELQVLFKDPILFEFVLGMGLGVLFCEYRFRLPRTAAYPTVALGLALLALSAFVPAYDWSIPRLLKFGLPSLLLLGGLLLHPALAGWSIPRSLQFLGDASYSIYLTHTLVLLLFTTALPRIALLRRLPPDLLFTAMGLAIVVAGGITYIALERPLLHFARARRGTPAARRVTAS